MRDKCIRSCILIIKLHIIFTKWLQINSVLSSISIWKLKIEDERFFWIRWPTTLNLRQFCYEEEGTFGNDKFWIFFWLTEFSFGCFFNHIVSWENHWIDHSSNSECSTNNCAESGQEVINWFFLVSIFNSDRTHFITEPNCRHNTLSMTICNKI